MLGLWTSWRYIFGVVLALSLVLPATAARPLLDQPQWNAYFALYAQDSAVPWKPTTVRLDTYSGSPVDFAAYEVDPADVIVAGSANVARSIDTSHLKPVVTWRFDPPPGYRFVTNEVQVPLGQREGFFVIEARRGNVARQVWINRSRIGLVTRENAGSLVVWAVDLGTGEPVTKLPISFLVGRSLVDRTTDGNGMIVWRGRERPRFALAQRGSTQAFLSMLPQAPPPQSVVGIRLASPVVRAGTDMRYVGFARTRERGGYRPSRGEATIALLERGRAVATEHVALDRAGAFAGDFAVPKRLADGDYVLLATVAGASSGAGVHVNASSELTLAATRECPCSDTKPVTFVVHAEREGVPARDIAIAVDVVRSPHIRAPGSGDAPLWGTTDVLRENVRTDERGDARVIVGAPTDGLASTYGLHAQAPGASVATVVTVPTSKLALSIVARSEVVSPGASVGFDVRGFDARSGIALGGIPVTVTLAHGPEAVRADATLDGHGFAHVVLAPPSLGTNLAIVKSTAPQMPALDVTSVTATTEASAATALSDADVTLDRSQYRPRDRARVTAYFRGAQGDGLVGIDGVDAYETHVVPLRDGRAAATFVVPEAQGDVRADTALVADGAVVFGSTPIPLDAPGHARGLRIVRDQPLYHLGQSARLTIDDGGAHDAATIAVRVTAEHASGSASFADAPALLSVGTTAMQTSAPPSPAWHAWVAAENSPAAKLFASDSPLRSLPTPPALGAEAPPVAYWHVSRTNARDVVVPVPAEAGRYVVSILMIFDDGDVGAATTTIDVRA